MKTKLLTLIVLFAFCISGYAQDGSVWKWSHQKPQGNDLRWVKMWDANNWYAIGFLGTFIKTTNAGTTWTFHHKAGLPDAINGNFENLYDAHFFDINTGIAVGVAGCVARTTDGGTTWSAISLSSSATLYKIYFVDNLVGYIAGTSSVRIAKTTDGGLTWTPNTVITSASYYDVYANGSFIIASSTSGNIRRSTDDGLTWATVLTGATSSLWSIEFTDANNGWVAGSSSAARYTTDGGLSWNNANTGIPASITFYDIDYHNGAVYLTGNSFDIYKTTDNGANWTQVEFLGPFANQPWTDTYYSTSFLGDNFVTVGGTGLINSVAGAAAPVAHTYWPKAGTLYDIWAESSTGRIIAVGDNGNATTFDQLIYSTDGGTTWTVGHTTADYSGPSAVQLVSDEPIPDAPGIFRGVDMITPTLGYTAGQYGALYRTTNGGATWDSVFTGAGNIYWYDIDFINANTGWVVGASGNCWKTTDAGATWTQQTTTLTGIIYSISMASSTHGWLGGASGTVNYTTDGGTTWSLQTSGMGTSVVYGMKAIDALTAYLSGSSGKVGKTTNGGTTWNLITTLPAEIGSSTLYSVDFRDQNNGIVGGSVGKTASTTDGGVTWQFASTSGSTIYSVKIALAGLDTTSVFAAGTSAFIHKNSLFIVPVEFTSFTSSVTGNSVTLNWTTATEKNNSGFAVERKSGAGDFIQVSFVEGNGTTTNISKYSYSENVQTGSYIYRLKQIDFDGGFSYSKEISVEVSVPEVFALEQNYPNPFNPATVIRYAIPQDGMVSLSIYNVLGQKVGTLVNQVQKAGKYDVTFDAGKYSSGIYFYKIESGNFSSVKKMMLVK